MRFRAMTYRLQITAAQMVSRLRACSPALVFLIFASLACAGGESEPGSVQEFNRMVSECPAEDIPGRLELARWAKQHDLPVRADALYREILVLDPEHEGAYRELTQFVQSHSPGRRSKAYEATRQALPGEFREYETKRFIIFSNADSRWTREQSGRLEGAHHQFQRFADRLGVKPLPLKHKLVCVLFAEREGFAAFGSSRDRMNDSWSFGYYSPRSDRIVFFNGEAEKDADEFAAERSMATTIHEAIHQLSFHTRVQTVYVQYPLWINEGLATAFETDRPKDAFGPDHEFEPRRERFNALLRNDELIPLGTLVRYESMPDDGWETVSAVYSQSYALVTWLFRHRKEELREYLMLMLKQPPGRPGEMRQLEIFEQAFGDVDELEKAWLGDESCRIGMLYGPGLLIALIEQEQEWMTGRGRPESAAERSA